MSDSQSEFRRGVEFYAKEMGAFVGGEHTRLTNGEYLSSIQTEIDNLSDAINKYAGNRNEQLKGFVAEAWHTYTFNIDAAAKRSANRAFQEESNKLGSVDISTDWGGDYSLKYYKSGADSANSSRALIRMGVPKICTRASTGSVMSDERRVSVKEGDRP